MTNQSLLDKARSLLNWKDPMKKQPYIKSTEKATMEAPQALAAQDTTTPSGPAAARKKVQAPELPVPEAISSLAVSALAIANAADTILRKSGANFGLADWALLRALGAKSEAQLMGKLGIDLAVTRQRVQKQVDELQKAGFVSVSASADDKRSRHVALTPAGQEALAAAANLWSLELAKTPLLGEMKSQAMVQRRVDRIAHSLNRTLRADKKEAMAAKKAAKSDSQSPEAATTASQSPEAAK